MKSKEFIESYSDDMVYLVDIRNKYLSNPFINACEPLFIPFITRNYCICIIGGLESMIKEWTEKDKKGILKPFFSDLSNKRKVNDVTRNFKSNGLLVDENILEDYLAIKYLRNSIVHSKWKENEKKFVLERNFPTDVMNFTDEHFRRMFKVNNHMQKYIAATENIHLMNIISEDLPEIGAKFYTAKHFISGLRNNFDEMASYIKSNPENIDFDDFSKQVLLLWESYTLLLKDKISFINIEKSIEIMKSNLIIRDKLSVFNKFDYDKILKESDKDIEEIYSCFFDSPSFTTREILEAIKDGKTSYNYIKNMSWIFLFKTLEMKSTVHKIKLKEICSFMDLVFKLDRLYYNYIK